MRAQDLKGKTVIALREAERLGEVDDVALDLERQRVAGFWLGSGGILNTGLGRFIPAEAIHSIGEDAITVDLTVESLEARALGDEPEAGGGPIASEWPRLGELMGARVVTESGNLLGEVKEIEFDPNTLNFEGFHLATKGRGWRSEEHLLPATSVISQGDQLLMVREAPGGFEPEAGQPAPGRSANPAERSYTEAPPGPATFEEPPSR